jgi:hypothetical protein
MDRPIRLRLASGIAAIACYSGCVVPILLVRDGPQDAETRGNSTSVGRPAEYKTFWEYAGRVFLWSRASNRPGCRVGSRSYGGRKLRISSCAAMARALPLSHQIGSRLCRSAIGILALASTPLLAQSVDDPFGIQKAYLAKKMVPVCTSGFLKRAFVLEMFGHLESRSSTDEESRAEEALAEELTSQTFLVVKSAKWEGNLVSGACHLDMKVTLPADYVSKLGGQNVLRGDMWFNMEARDTHWKLLSITDYQGSGDNSFRRFLAPFTQALVQARLNAAKEARIAEAKRVDAQQKAAEQQQADQAAAARREWIRKHPAEYAAQQRAEANRRAAQVADERRRRLACEARGGTWGQTVLDANFGFAPSCHFKIAQ